MKLSIITINYNNAIGLEETIKSVIKQNFTDYEYIIIDGDSNDGSVDIIRKYSEHIDYWISEPDKGIYNAMNKGVIHAHGEYCIFMNSGDCFYSQNVIKSIIEKGYQQDIITGDTVERNSNRRWFNMPEEMSFLHLFRDNISHQSSFIKTTFLKEMPYNENLEIVADWEFFIKAIIFRNCSFTYDNTIVAKIDLGGISILNKEQRNKERTIVLKSLFPKRIISDYEKIKYVDTNTLNLINKISKTNRIKNISNKVLCILSKFIR